MMRDLSFTLREERIPRVSESSLLSKMFGFKRDEVVGGCRNCMGSFIICTFHKVLLQ
jgi:hypothetical protein